MVTMNGSTTTPTANQGSYIACVRGQLAHELREETPGPKRTPIAILLQRFKLKDAASPAPMLFQNHIHFWWSPTRSGGLARVGSLEKKTSEFDY